MTVSFGLPETKRVEISSTTQQTRENFRTMSFTYSNFIHPIQSLDVQYQQGSYSASYLSEANFVQSHLPEEFQIIQESPVPLLQNAEDCDHDFIVVAEFSELEGPVPLCTIPHNAPMKTDINLSSLAVHLMSTDYQVNTVGHFKICQDTQVLRKNVFRNVHVFMQYFTLYDIKARGFVRPFCFGYVSKDHVKLDKHINLLRTEFDRYTQILKQTNRLWFASELSQYLHKLKTAKENFLQDFVPKNADKDVFYFDVGEGQEDPDAITLNQLAHQYSEIENILRAVVAAHNPSFESEIQSLSDWLDKNPDTPIVSTLDGKKILASPNSSFSSSETIDIPLLHPLKSKGEALRPITTLGQLGSVILIWKLLLVHRLCEPDIIFSEMGALTNDFRINCKNMKLKRQSALESSMLLHVDTANPCLASSSETTSSSHSSPKSNSDDCNNYACHFLFSDELSDIIEKLYSNVPVVSDNGSGSYHTVSEDESDVNLPNRDGGNESESNGYVSAFGSVENCSTAGKPSTSNKTNGAIPATAPAKGESRKMSTCSDTQMSRTSLSSFSSEDDLSSTSGDAFALQLTSEEVIVKKVPWWESASQKLTRGQSGYGLRKFFRRYHKVAHHILFSILIGRPLIICAEEKDRLKVAAIVTALTPLVPCFPKRHWKLLRWHRGILVQAHLKIYKLVGLCIPERHNVLDLLHPRDQNFVTIFNIDKRTILGPAYQGNFFQNFENLGQNQFYDSDVSLLTYIGSILTEIESKVFMFKSLEGTQMTEYFKQLNLRSSDIEIVRCLGNMVADADNSAELF